MGETLLGDADFASQIETDLRALKIEEIDTLTRHGAALLSHRISTYASGLIGGISTRSICDDFDRQEMQSDAPWDQL